MNRALKIFLILATALPACGGGEFTAESVPDAVDPSGPGGEAGDRGSTAGDSGSGPTAGDPGVAGALGGGGSEDGLGGSGSGLGGSGSNGGQMAAGANGGTAGANQAGSSGAPQGGSSGAPQGGASGGGASGAPQGGSSAVNDPRYECSAPASLTHDQAFACYKKVCSNLGYQCGTFTNDCAVEDTTPCGIPASQIVDCSYFLSQSSCPAYEDCNLSTHQCGNQCLRDKVTDPSASTCNEPTSFGSLSGSASFRYQCSQSNPSPGDCVPDAGHGSSTWCCSQNSRGCSVQAFSVQSSPLCTEGQRYVYTCRGSVSPNTTSCSKMGAGKYCCSSPNLE